MILFARASEVFMPLLGVVLAAFSSGCEADPIVGYWESRYMVDGARDQIIIDASLVGELWPAERSPTYTGTRPDREEAGKAHLLTVVPEGNGAYEIELTFNPPKKYQSILLFEATVFNEDELEFGRGAMFDRAK